MMPIYNYKCPKCRWADEVVKPMSASNTVEICRQCGIEMERDFSAEVPTSNGGSYEARPIHSDALAIHPDQVQEHRAKFPDVPLDSACRPVLSNFKQHDRYLEQRGIVKHSHNKEF